MREAVCIDCGKGGGFGLDMVEKVVEGSFSFG